MRLAVILFTLFAVGTFSSCKSDRKESAKEAPKKENMKKADFGDLYQNYHASPTTLAQHEENAIIDYLADKEFDAVRTQNGVYIHISELGPGGQLKKGDNVTVDYRGYFIDGKEFDSSYGRGEPITFFVGEMNAGWNDAFPYLTVGTKASIYIPSRMGYGAQGFPGYVDPNTTIFFDVDILKKN